MLANGKILLIQNEENGLCLKTHPDDLKPFIGEFQKHKKQSTTISDHTSLWREAFEYIDKHSYEADCVHDILSISENVTDQQVSAYSGSS